MKQELNCINTPAPQGWVCPKCGRVYSPYTPMCLYCGNGNVEISYNNIQKNEGSKFGMPAKVINPIDSISYK